LTKAAVDLHFDKQL